MATLRELADTSGYTQPNGEHRSYLLADGAQLVPGSFTDVASLGADFLAFSFHKPLAPFGTGVLYAREELLTGPGLAGPLGRTRQLCVHCHENPAGFWVSRRGAVTRRPWCLCCITELDRAQCDVVPFGGGARLGGRPQLRWRR